jgi:adenosylcobalamin-dependent ribonucleoside-triphosphate reductase
MRGGNSPFLFFITMKIITEEFLEKYKNKTVPWGFNGLGAIVYSRTYSREMQDGKKEEWGDTITRCINGAQEIGAGYSQEEAEKLFDYIYNLKCSFAGRMLWMLGTETIRRYGGNAANNCWFVAINELEDFCFLFENLMLGGGVGFSVKREDVHELPKIKENVIITHQNTKDADFIIPDSREGWVELLRKVLKAYFIKGKSFTYSAILVRGYGEKINGLGGTASGASILIEGIENICKIFKSREGKKLRSIDVLDICNIISSIVISGNLRRSATISLGDPDDYLFIRAKRWDLGNIPNWRAMSNNTILADDFTHIQNDIWEGFKGNGEPYGLFNLPLSQKYGRLNEHIKDSSVVGINPCGEITLPSYGACCLSELFLNNITSKEELIECAKLLYKTQKAVCSLPYLHEKTNKVVHKDYRIGVSITGICQSLNKLEWFDECYKELRAFDKIWSKQNNLPESIKLTTTKPSGTISLLSGSTPGIHPAYAKYYIRRVRMSSNDPLIEKCNKAGYKIEYVKGFDGEIDYKTSIVEFPCFSGENALLAKNVSAIQQLELIKKIQTIWSDNSVSCTIYYKKEELEDIKKWLKDNYKDSIKSVSFLLHKDHGFQQAPYEEITKEQYEELISKVKPLKDINLTVMSELENLECSTGSCPIK